MFLKITIHTVTEMCLLRCMHFKLFTDILVYFVKECYDLNIEEMPKSQQMYPHYT